LGNWLTSSALQQQKSLLHCRQLTANFVGAMPEITAQIFGVTFDSSFKTPVLFKDARCEEIAQKALEAFASYGLKPTQIGFRRRDPAFNYELSFSLFKGNANFTLSAEKLHLDFQNAVNERDLEIIEDCVAKTYEHIPLPEIGTTFISANLHATATSADEAQKFLSARRTRAGHRFGWNPGEYSLQELASGDPLAGGAILGLPCRAVFSLGNTPSRGCNLA
jgi:hypothetical protein